VPQAVDILGLVAAHLAIEQAGFGALGAFCPARCEAPALVEAVRGEETAQRGIGRHRRERGIALGERQDVVVMQLDAPALVRGVLRQHGLAYRGAHRSLRASVLTQLTPQHRDRIVPLLACPVIPALQGGDAEADRLATDRMTPRARGELIELQTQHALARRRRQQLADHRKAKVRPLLVDPRPASLRHASAPKCQEPQP